MDGHGGTRGDGVALALDEVNDLQVRGRLPAGEGDDRLGVEVALDCGCGV